MDVIVNGYQTGFSLWFLAGTRRALPKYMANNMDTKGKTMTLKTWKTEMPARKKAAEVGGKLLRFADGTYAAVGEYIVGHGHTVYGKHGTETAYENVWYLEI